MNWWLIGGAAFVTYWIGLVVASYLLRRFGWADSGDNSILIAGAIFWPILIPVIVFAAMPILAWHIAEEQHSLAQQRRKEP